MFQRRHYEAIAEIIREACEDNDIVRVELVSRFIDYLAKDNPRFNATAFTDACWKGGKDE